MWKLIKENRQLCALILAVIFLNGCGYSIKYNLDRKDIIIPESTIPLKVQVVTFSDNRGKVEKEKSARKAKGESDIADYTYDKEFQGVVAYEITKMLVKHLNYSKLFSPQVELASFGYDQISEEKLDYLQKAGFDAVLTGRISHFYGYYDRNIGKQLVYSLPLAIASGLLLSWTTTSGNYEITYYWYGPGLALGYYLESLHKRRIEHRTTLIVKLISTTTHQPFWQKNFDVFITGLRSMPGISTERRKYEVSVSSLREAVNNMIMSLAKNSEEIYQNRNQIVIEEKIEQIEHITEAERQIDLSKPFPQEKRTKFGLKVGMNMANFSGDDAEGTDSKIGLAIGGSFTFNLNDKFAIRPEFFYSTKGSKFEESIFDDFTVRSTTSLNYLDIPILVVYSIQENLKLFAGPSLGIYINGKSEWEISGDFLGVEIDDSGSENIESDEINSPDFGLVFGASYSLGKISIEPRYSMGLVNVLYIDNEDTDMKNRVIQLMVGYSF